MTIPGISVVQRSQATIRSTTRSIDRACFIGFVTPVDAVNLNALVPVSDLSNFSAKFTGASDTLIASVRVFFRNYPEERLFFGLLKVQMQRLLLQPIIDISFMPISNYLKVLILTYIFSRFLTVFSTQFKLSVQQYLAVPMP